MDNKEIKIGDGNIDSLREYIVKTGNAEHKVVRKAGITNKKEVKSVAFYGKPGKGSVHGITRKGLLITISMALVALAMFSSKYHKAKSDLVYKELHDYDPTIGSVEMNDWSGKYDILDIDGKYYNSEMIPDSVWEEATPSFSEIMDEMRYDNIEQPKLGGR